MTQAAYVSFWKAKKPTKADANRAAYELAQAHHPKFKKAYQVALDDVADPKVLNALAESIRSRAIASVDALLPPYDPTRPEAAARWGQAVQTFEDRYAALLKASGKQTLASLDVDMSFRLDNPYSLPWIDKKAGALIKNISEDARQNLRGLVRQSFTADNIPPMKLKAMIKTQIGLRPAQAESVARRLQNALSEGVPQDKALAMAQRYADRALSVRAEAIARTETIAAEAQGQLDAWRSAQDEGLIVGGTRREWVASSEEKGACKWCAALDGIIVAFDEPFTTHFGKIMAPPAHVNCRCTVVLVAPGDDGDMTEDVKAPPKSPPKPKAPKPQVVEPPPVEDLPVPKPVEAPRAAEPPPRAPEPPPAAKVEAIHPASYYDTGAPDVKLIAPATAKEVTALYDYQGENYEIMNAYLRGGSKNYPIEVIEKETRDAVERVQKLMNKHVLAEPVTLYRGIGATPERMQSLQPGARFEDKGFFSTSASKDVAASFATSAAANRTAVVMEVRVPSGAKAVPMYDTIKDRKIRSTVLNEKEFLLQDSRKFRVLEVLDEKDKYGTPYKKVVMEMEP